MTTLLFQPIVTGKQIQLFIVKGNVYVIIAAIAVKIGFDAVFQVFGIDAAAGKCLFDRARKLIKIFHETSSEASTCCDKTVLTKAYFAVVPYYSICCQKMQAVYPIFQQILRIRQLFEKRCKKT